MNPRGGRGGRSEYDRRLRALPPVESQRAERFKAVHPDPAFVLPPEAEVPGASWADEPEQLERVAGWIADWDRRRDVLLGAFALAIVAVLAFAIGGGFR